MRILAIILLTACMAASAKGFTQITLTQKDVPLQTVLKEIGKQSGYDIVFTYEMVQSYNKVTVNLKNVSLEQALNESLKNTGLTFSIVGKIVAIRQKDKSPNAGATNITTSPITTSLIDISGKITDQDGNPLAGANVKVKGTDKGTTTNNDGVFILKGVDENAVLEISFVGYQPITVAVNNRTAITASLKVNPKPLEEIVVRKGYYNEKRATTTGDVGTITAKDIEKQPVSNALLAIQARIPGIIVGQSTGLPGSGVTVQIRGRNSLTKGNEPLYIIDGVPYSSLNLPSISYVLGQSNNSGGGGPLSSGSPFSYINPADIEAIDVLKDADATAIYGSRGANGVVLITTKRGKPGQAKVNVNIQSGVGKVPRELNVLNTRQYLDMRYEAFKNDNATPNPNVDYDLTLWDTTRYTDWQKVLIGNTARYNDAQASISGGNANTQFLFGMGYHKETTVFPGDFNDQRASAHFNISNISSNKKFTFLVSGIYALDDNQLPGYDLTEQAIKLAPDAPSMYNADGSINWAPNANGVSTWPFNNPAAMMLLGFTTKTNNLISNANLSYQISKGLEIKSSFGYNNIQTDEVQTIPLTVYDPSTWNIKQRSSDFGNNHVQSWIVEPQISYSRPLLKGELNVLLGGTAQQNRSNRLRMQATGFNSDLVLDDVKAATSVTILNTVNSVYKYAAAFGRLNYNWHDKYIINLTGRRDGTSRFGPANRFHNFGAAGIGWVFSKEKFIQQIFPSLSFGKLRASFGNTGSDQVGDYSFMDLYAPVAVGVPYQGANGIRPNSIYTPDLEWEETRKLEGGIELGFIDDRIVAKASYYRNRSFNQLLAFPLPAITGFTTIQKNLYALVQNKGWEFELNTINVEGLKLQWSSAFNLTLNRNKLISAPDGLGSIYENLVGHSIQSRPVLHLTGVNFLTGVYEFADSHGGSTANPDRINDSYYIDAVPKFYGGFLNSFSCKSFQLDFLFQYKKQPIAAAYLYNYIPGFFNDKDGSNQPVTVLDRWQRSGDVKSIQRFSQNSSLAFVSSYATDSDQQFSDGSFIRLKNASLSWQFPKQWKEKLHMQNARLYAQGQNLVTITNCKGLDPETGSLSLPPLRTITIGVQLTL